MSSPKAPAAPDYAKANREGIEASIEMLPLQLQADRAARLGTTYRDPKTGKVYDFSGLGDAKLDELDIARSERLLRSGADIQRELTRGEYNDLLDLLPKYNQLNLDAQRQAYDASLEAGEKGTRQGYDLNMEYMPKFGELQRKENELSFLENLRLGELGTRQVADLQNELLPAANEAGLEAQHQAMLKSLESFKESDPERYALQQRLIAAANDDLDAGASLTPEQLEAMQQNVRGAQAARGNILGAGAAYDEGRMATQMGTDMQQQRRATALGILQGSDVAPRFGAASAVNPLMPQYGSQTPLNPQNPNFNATTAGGPNLNPVNINSSGPFSVVDQNAGAGAVNFAQSNYNQQMQAHSQKGNPWMQGLGLAIGGASMFMTGGASGALMAGAGAAKQ